MDNSRFRVAYITGATEELLSYLNSIPLYESVADISEIIWTKDKNNTYGYRVILEDKRWPNANTNQTSK